MSANTHFQSDLEADRIPAHTLSYVGERARNRFYDFVLKRFAESGMSKADLARKIGKGPDRVNRLLGAPGNWTIETIAELLAGISGEEVVPSALPFMNRTCSNMSQDQLLEHLLGSAGPVDRAPLRAGVGKTYSLTRITMPSSAKSSSQLEITG